MPFEKMNKQHIIGVRSGKHESFKKLFLIMIKLEKHKSLPLTILVYEVQWCQVYSHCFATNQHHPHPELFALQN